MYKRQLLPVVIDVSGLLEVGLESGLALSHVFALGTGLEVFTVLAVERKDDLTMGCDNTGGSRVNGGRGFVVISSTHSFPSLWTGGMLQ